MHPSWIFLGGTIPTAKKQAEKHTYGLKLGGSRASGDTVEQVTDVIREAVLDGRLPASSWLREADLSTELGVSRTPVREALRRLAVEGLVVKSVNRGTVVAPMTLEDVLAVYLVRERLEGLAARLAAGQAAHAYAERFGELQRESDEALKAGDTKALIRLNIEFHRLIRAAANNSYLDRFLTQVEHAVRRFPSSTYEVPSRAEAALAEHREIAEAILSGDPDTAERVAMQHMREARDLRIRMVLPYDGP